MPSSDPPSGTSSLLIATIVLTVLAAVAGGVYMSGAADDVVKFVMEKYFKAEAKAEEKMLEKSGETAAEGFLFVFSLQPPPPPPNTSVLFLPSIPFLFQTPFLPPKFFSFLFCHPDSMISIGREGGRGERENAAMR